MPATIRRLLQRLWRPPAPADLSGREPDTAAPHVLAPEGARSGEGTQSIGPYLENALSSRPAPLE